MAHEQDWWGLLRQPNVHAACVLQIEGIPYVFSSHALNDIRNAPIDEIDIDGETYTLRPMLSPDVVVSLPGLKMASGIGTPTNSSFQLVDDQTDFLLSYFKMEGANRTRMTTDTAFGAVNMDVVSTTGFAAVGTLYCARETMTYAAVAAAQFQGLTRGLYGSLAASFEVTDDLSEMHTEITNQKVSDYPRVWKGRWVRLWLVMLSDLRQDEIGVLFSDSVLGGVYTIDNDEWAGNVWSGVIEDVSPDDNFCSVLLECRDILSKCYGTINARSAKARLWVPDGMYIYIPRGRRAFNCTLQLNDNALTSPQTFPCISTLSPLLNNWLPIDEFCVNLRNALNTALTASFAAAGFAADYVAGSAAVDMITGDDWKGMEIKFNVNSAPTRAWSLIHRVDVNTEVPWPVQFGSLSTMRAVAGGGAGIDVYSFAAYGFPDFYLSAEMSEIYIVPEDVTQWPTSSYITISSEDGYQEIAKYAGAAPAATVYAGQNVYAIYCQANEYGRGKVGTTSRPLVWGCSGIPEDHSIAISYGLSSALAADALYDPRTVQVDALFTSEQNFWTIVLYLMVSTYGGNNGAYDVGFMSNAGAGLGIAERHIDIGAFQRLITTDTEFSLVPFLGNDLEFQAFLSDHAFFAGSCVLSGPHGQYYQISPVYPSGSLYPEEALVASDILWAEPPRITGLGDVVNQIVCKFNWDPRTSKYTEPGITISHLSSIADYGKSEAVEMRAQGLQLDLSCQILCAALHSAEVFSRLAEPRYRLRLGLTAIGWKLKPGMVVSVTHQAIWGMDGTRGITDEAFLVCDVEKRLLGSGPAAIVTLEKRLDQQLTYWSPTATVSVIAGGGVTLTVNANDWTNANEQYTDAEYFEIGYAVQCTNMLLNVTVQDTVANRVGNTITLAGGVPGAWAVGDVIYLWYDDWVNQVAAQRLRSISQSSAAGYVSGTTEGYQWA